MLKNCSFYCLIFVLETTIFFSGFFNELKVRKKQHLFETDLFYTVKNIVGLT